MVAQPHFIAFGGKPKRQKNSFLCPLGTILFRTSEAKKLHIILFQAYLDYVVFINAVARQAKDEMAADGSTVLEEEHMLAALAVCYPSS
jgi:hypothetical protein